MIDKIRLRNFKGHLDTTVPLGRFTVLVGDNASGKTSVLEALSLLTMLGPTPHTTLQSDLTPGDLIRRNSTKPLALDVEGRWPAGAAGARASFHVELAPDESIQDGWKTSLQSQIIPPSPARVIEHRFSCNEYRQTTPISITPPWLELATAFKRAPLYSLDAQAVAAGAFGAGQADQLLNERGANATAVLANMKLERDEDFDRVELALRRLVPTVRRIRLHPVRQVGGAGHKTYFDFQGASSVPAHCASHGTLIALALLTILYGPDRPDFLLLDDFDHALHPRAQLELVKMLKELLALPDFADLQIAATTHSPYVLDKLTVEDVRVFALREDGTVAMKSLAEHPSALSSRGMVSAGQLWSMDAEQDWVLGG
jgi:AAA domain, putative AbiEii toxin, Type IV TA system/AAA ATPase domain